MDFEPRIENLLLEVDSAADRTGLSEPTLLRIQGYSTGFLSTRKA
jgi:hypothetical protein